MATLNESISRLAHLPPSTNPIISCFVNTVPMGNGRPSHLVFLKKAFAERIRSFPERSAARDQLEADRDRILDHLASLDPVPRSAAVYACSAEDLWESLEFRATFDDHRLVVGPVPHLYPLVKLADQAPRYAVCVVDVHQARLVVAGLGAMMRMPGWSLLALGAASASAVMCAIDWPETKVGLSINAAIIAVVLAAQFGGLPLLDL